jgi:hypothetical protein
MLPPLVMVIQLTVLVAVQAQLEPVVTAMLALVPVEGADALVGDTLYVQLFAACVIVTVCPAIAIVPVRATPPEFAATV